MSIDLIDEDIQDNRSPEEIQRTNEEYWSDLLRDFKAAAIVKAAVEDMTFLDEMRSDLEYLALTDAQKIFFEKEVTAACFAEARRSAAEKQAKVCEKEMDSSPADNGAMSIGSSSSSASAGSSSLRTPAKVGSSQAGSGMNTSFSQPPSTFKMSSASTLLGDSLPGNAGSNMVFSISTTNCEFPDASGISATSTGTQVQDFINKVASIAKNSFPPRIPYEGFQKKEVKVILSQACLNIARQRLAKCTQGSAEHAQFERYLEVLRLMRAKVEEGTDDHSLERDQKEAAFAAIQALFREHPKWSDAKKSGSNAELTVNDRIGKFKFPRYLGDGGDRRLVDGTMYIDNSQELFDQVANPIIAILYSKEAQIITPQRDPDEFDKVANTILSCFCHVNDVDTKSLGAELRRNVENHPRPNTSSPKVPIKYDNLMAIMEAFTDAHAHRFDTLKQFGIKWFGGDFPVGLRNAPDSVRKAIAGNTSVNYTSTTNIRVDDHPPIPSDVDHSQSGRRRPSRAAKRRLRLLSKEQAPPIPFYPK
jgi:hypothetical protein